MGESVFSPGTPIGGVPALAVVIGASAGGPPAIAELLAKLPWNFPTPVLICQHMTEGATASWAHRLDDTCRLRVIEARQGEPLLARCAYIAPTGRHLRVRGTAAEAFVSLEDDRTGSRYVPSIDECMTSAAQVWGSRAVGVLLTGMGADGARGLLAMRLAGAVTIAQSPESAFIDSMPSAAVMMGAAAEVVPLERMAATIQDRVAGRV